MSHKSHRSDDEGSAHSFSFRLNGETVHVSNVATQTTLLDYVRSRNLTGAKEGCAEGECGACAVALVKARDGACVYVPCNSCLLFLPMVAGQEVYTVESLGRPDNLHAVQKAMADAGGSQCGYCTPGFTVSLFAEYYRPGRSGPCSIDALGGNLCRCTGYRPIRDAALSLEHAPHDGFSARLSEPAPEIGSVEYRYNNTEFSRPATLSESLAVLRYSEDARLVAGNTDLGVDSNLKYARYRHLVSVEAIPELHIFQETDEFVEIGSALSLSEIESYWTTAPPVIDEWLPLFASPLIRNRATLGGNLATASPIGDAAPVLLALDAQVKIAGADGTRTEPLSAFFTGYRKTLLNPRDVLVSVVIQKPYPMHARFFKAAKRRLDDISTVAACFAVSLDRSRRVQSARIAFGGVAAVPLRVPLAEDRLIGQIWNSATIGRAQEAIASTLTPMSDHRGSADYRLSLAQSVLEKFWSEIEEVAA